MNTQSEQKPGLFTAIALMTLVSGIINLFWGFIFSATALGTLVGIVCLPAPPKSGPLASSSSLN